MSTLLWKYIDDETGATAIEYALIASLIAVAIVATLTILFGNLNNVYTEIANDLS